MNLFMELKAIFFDLDNTLIDRTSAAYDIYCDIVSDCFPDWDKNSIEYEAAVQKLMVWDEFGTIEKAHVFGRFCREYHLEESTVEALTRRWMKEFGDYARPFEKSAEVLGKLRKKYRLGLLTNGDPYMQRTKLYKSGLENYFEIVIVSGEQGIHKPDVRIFELACSRMGLQPNEIGFVGDTFSTDILGAVRCGMKPIWIHSDYLYKTNLDMIKIHHIEELPDIL